MNGYAEQRRGRGAGGQRGFTLIEVIVVMVILGLLAGLVGPRLFGRVSSAKEETARAQIELLALSLDNYRLDNGHYPTTEQGLRALWERPTAEPAPRNWRGPYTRKAIPEDPWGNPYVYRNPGEANPNGYDLLSLGSDGEPGGEGEAGDIKGWE